MRALVAAEEASASKDAFLANIAHEIRTPLNGVLGMAQVMGAEDLSPAQRERLDVINRSGRALLSLLNDVLDLSKIEAGKLQLEVVDFDLEQLLTDLGQVFQAACDDKNVEVIVACEASISGSWRGDPARIRQIVTNLLSNAVKFTREGEVRVEASGLAQGMEITVSDTGIGIAPDRLERVFDKYEQASARTARQYGGTGLGLAICRELAHHMAGTVTAESRPGRGTTFSVKLPLPRGEGPAGPAQPDEFPSFDQTSLRVLAADDHPTNRLVLRMLLEQLGVQVELVGDGRAAVEAWRRERWDLILMDVQNHWLSAEAGW